MRGTEDLSGYQPRIDVNRNYRLLSASDLFKERIVMGESDLWVLATQNVRAEVAKLLKFYRRQLKEYIFHNQLFKTTLEPYPADLEAPELIQWMIAASTTAGVGPMASVAGAIAGILGKSISRDVSPELIIENGGDIYLRSTKERCIAIFAGDSPFSLKIGLVVPPQYSGIGICTSAGTVGPSLSFGSADAVVVVAADVALADAAATAIGNRIRAVSDLQRAIDFAKSITGLAGVLLIIKDKMAAWGEIEITSI